MDKHSYQEIRADMRPAFPMSLTSKMWLTVGTLLISTLAAPAAYIRRDQIRAVEGTTTLPETMSLFAGVLILIGNVNTFFIGLYLLKYVRERSQTPSLTRAEIEKQFRVQDFAMWFNIWGTLAVLAPLALLVVAGLFPGIIEPMYAAGFTIYRPFELATVDIRLVSAISGAGLGLLLGAMWWYVK